MSQQGFTRVAGLDEAGRGSLFGPVFAAAVVFDPDRPVDGVEDSKTLTPGQRNLLAEMIRERAVCWAVAAADANEIDRLNIYEASRLAMTRALEGLHPRPDYLLLDAMRLPCDLPQESLIKGDARVASIAAASILAKVERDACMDAWAAVYPGFGLDHHKGYATATHLAALERFGPTPLHRLSYRPVRRCDRFSRLLRAGSSQERLPFLEGSPSH